MTWRDGAAAWPRRLETDRSRIHHPDSIGVHLHGSPGPREPEEAELLVVLHRGGRADVDYPVSADDAGAVR